MRQTVQIKNLPGADTLFAGGALKNLAVACSHPDIIAGAGSSGLVGGAERDEVRACNIDSSHIWILLHPSYHCAPQVYVKYKCGSAPQVTHFYVLLYLDRLMARPVEIWQVRKQRGMLCNFRL